MKRNPFYGKLLRSSSSRPFPRLCVPSVALNPISLTNADCVHHAFEEIGLIKKSFPFSEINFPKIKFFSELRQATPIWASLRKKRQNVKEENGKPTAQKQECGCTALQPSLISHTHAFSLPTGNSSIMF